MARPLAAILADLRARSLEHDALDRAQARDNDAASRDARVAKLAELSALSDELRELHETSQNGVDVECATFFNGLPEPQQEAVRAAVGEFHVDLASRKQETTELTGELEVAVAAFYTARGDARGVQRAAEIARAVAGVVSKPTTVRDGATVRGRQ